MSQATVVYGIPNCDRVRAARGWLARNDIDYRFHDVRADGLTRPLVEGWIARLGSDALLNRRSATWRRLSERARVDMTNMTAVELLLEHPTLLKRPLLETDGALRVGFDEAEWARTLER